MSNEIKIRIAGVDKAEVERLTEKLREWSKQWGSRKIFSVRRYDREKGKIRLWKYHRTFGNARFVNYIKLKLPEISAN